jgi:hypothetical protein
MPNLQVSIPHQLGRVEARRRIDERLTELRQHQGGMLTSLHGTWTGDTMNFTVSAMGQTVTGKMTVEEQALHLDVALPWFLHMLAGGFKHQLEQQGRKLLELSAK